MGTTGLAYQEDIGPHWSKGWIVEDCDVSHSAFWHFLGKYLQPDNDNKWLMEVQDGTQTERDAICQASYEG